MAVSKKAQSVPLPVDCSLYCTRLLRTVCHIVCTQRTKVHGRGPAKRAESWMKEKCAPAGKETISDPCLAGSELDLLAWWLCCWNLQKLLKAKKRGYKICLHTANIKMSAKICLRRVSGLCRNIKVFEHLNKFAYYSKEKLLTKIISDYCKENLLMTK